METVNSLVAQTRGVQTPHHRSGQRAACERKPPCTSPHAWEGAAGGSYDSCNGDPLLVAPHVARMAALMDGEGEALIDFDGLGPLRLPTRTRTMIYGGYAGGALSRGVDLRVDRGASRAWALPAASPNHDWDPALRAAGVEAGSPRSLWELLHRVTGRGELTAVWHGT